MRYLILCICLLRFLFSTAQATYFPPLTGEDWERLDPSTLGWCPEKVDSLRQFLKDTHAKSFLILKEGRIVLETYFGEHQASDVWYWASASKSLVATLFGMAQEDGFLDINDPTSQYLGQGWTNTSPEQELAITIRSQLAMASGLDDGVEATGSTQNCFEPACFQFLAAPYTRWAYHNSAYRILQNVLETATGQNKFSYTRTRLGDRIGMKGFWLNYVYYSNARDMARFGLLVLERGIWDTDTLLHDQAYFEAMIQPSQTANPSYGYLWWLNGQESFQLPGVQFSINRALLPPAPADLFAALGKNDQKIYVVPSEEMVVVRQGDAAGGIVLTSSSFDVELWERLSDMTCSVSNIEEADKVIFSVTPNPIRDLMHIESADPVEAIRIYDLQGRTLLSREGAEVLPTISIAAFPKGTYFVQIRTRKGVGIRRVIKL